MTQRGMDRTRILLVDDSAADIELALEAFEEAGLAGAVQVVRSGGEALDWLMRSDGPHGRHPRTRSRT